MGQQEKLYFTSSYTIGKKEHKDINCISYQRAARDMRILTILSILIGVVLPILAGEIDGMTLCSSCALFFGAVIPYLVTSLLIQRAYTRVLVNTGKESNPYITKLGEKIITQGEWGSTREFDYSEITHIRQTREFYVLHVGQGLHIVVGKNVVSFVDDLEFIPFLMERCTNLKKKKVIDCTHYKAKALGCLVVNGFIVAIDLLMMVML